MNTVRLSEVEMDNKYYFWLCDLIKVNQPARSYWFLVKAMYEKEFEWYVPNDDNRVFEGKVLRERFCEENNLTYVYVSNYGWYERAVSLLEVVIGIAYRCENIMADSLENNLKMHEWFWKMIANAGLDRYADAVFEDLQGNVVVQETFTKIIRRTYNKDGKGGFFPIKKSKKDQRKVELWYQMSTYLVENYYKDE